jgi:hypothetical protein
VDAPRITLGMPLYNAERYLAETLDCLLEQDFQDFEIVISDNASTDRTAQICRSYMRRDARISYHRNAVNLGAAYNYSRLVDLARGELFKWASYDDLLAPGHLKECVAALDDNPRAVIAYPKTAIIDADGRVVSYREDRLQLLQPEPWARLRTFTRNWSLASPCFGLMRTDVMRRTRLIEPYLSSDLPFLADMTMLGMFVEVPQHLFFRRVHETSSVQGRLTRAQTAAWFDPHRPPPRLSARSLVFLHTVRTILLSELDLLSRARCLVAFVATWTGRRLRIRGGQVKAAVRRGGARRARRSGGLLATLQETGPSDGR